METRDLKTFDFLYNKVFSQLTEQEKERQKKLFEVFAIQLNNQFYDWPGCKIQYNIEMQKIEFEYKDTANFPTSIDLFKTVIAILAEKLKETPIIKIEYFEREDPKAVKYIITILIK